MSNVFCSPEGDASFPKWSGWDWFSWKMLQARMGGDWPRLWEYKDSWIAYNKNHIFSAARAARIPALLLGCVAHAEVGGKPDETKRPAFYARSFDWMGPQLADQLAVTKPPDQTSFGAVSIQLRAAARELGLNAETMAFSDQLDLIRCLETDTFNLSVVAKHLHSLILLDFPDVADSSMLTDEQFVIAGARYNRGSQRPLNDIRASIRAAPGSKGREYSDYGRAMLKHRDEVRRLLDL